MTQPFVNHFTGRARGQWPHILALTCALTLSASGTLPAAAANPGEVAARARPLSEPELRGIYAGKSWLWKDGAGYFAASKRLFSAWTGVGTTAAWAEGEWYIPRQGQLCFKAIWHTREGNAPATACYDHRTADRVIYQRRLPEGPWYVFASDPPLPDDEISKLRDADLVSANVERYKWQVKPRSW